MAHTQQEYQKILRSVFESVRKTGHETWNWDEGFFAQREKRYIHDATFLEEYFSGGKILEIGALPGHVSLFMKRLGYDIVSLDIAPERVQNFLTENELTMVRCDIEKEPLPFPDKTLSAVLFTEMLEHLRIDPLFVLSEINRVLMPDGIVFLSTPNLYGLDKRIRFIRGRGFNDPLEQFKRLREVGHMGHVREYSIPEVRRFLEDSGFHIIASRYHNYHNYGGGIINFIVTALQLPSQKLKTRQIHIATKMREIEHLQPLT